VPYTSCCTFQVLADCLQGRVPQSINWDSVLAAANRNLLTPAVYIALTEGGQLSSLPRELIDYLAFIHSRNLDRNQRLQTQLIEVVTALNKVGIKPLLTKGAVHLAVAPKNVFGARMMRDLDIVVAVDELSSAQACLLRLGYTKRGGLGWGRSKDVGLVDVHYPPGRFPAYWPDAKLLDAHATAIDIAGAQATILSPTLRAAHIVIHDMIKNGNWWLADLDMGCLFELYQLSQQGLEWEALQAAMTDARSQNALESEVLALRGFFGIQAPRLTSAKNLRPRWHHRRRIIQMRPLVGWPLRAAGRIAWMLRRMRAEWPQRIIGNLQRRLDPSYRQ
jgi:Uncharacterised nucleotidyltransferase